MISHLTPSCILRTCAPFGAHFISVKLPEVTLSKPRVTLRLLTSAPSAPQYTLCRDSRFQRTNRTGEALFHLPRLPRSDVPWVHGAFHFLEMKPDEWPISANGYYKSFMRAAQLFLPGKLHGRTSREWNLAEDSIGRTVCHTCVRRKAYR